MFNKILTVLLVLMVFSVSGCLSNGGESAYNVKPIETNTGKIICCDVTVNNTKDYDKLKMKLVIGADGTIEFQLDEDGVDASTPAMIQAENNAKLLDAVKGIIPAAKN